MPTSSCLKRAVLRGKTTCLDLRCYGRKRRKPAWRGLPGVSPRRAYRGLFLVFGGQGGIRTRGGLLTHTRFPGVRLKPLIHLSTAEPAMLPLGPYPTH
jgi:hypothetical protein